ncbi:uncharacterized protein KY384_003796 [Bacidia gigantensis]|uniref:uncharacterized protein n=1 Tax=Bacidia gigantensis TaxID=2732470 RepID=UPI001D038118|nr:uncharacterized protein KY384_003796 [Bacidia gigantensis]KAG8532156.1 hypothetical protein KY384_003796 [Bacidia gigantensis]
MFAPPGTGRNRPSNRSRGNTWGVGNGRDHRNGAGTASSGRRINANAGRAFDKLRGGGPPRQGAVHSNSQRNAPQQTATTSDSGNKTYSKNEPWRNPATENPATYKKRMNDLYQTLKEDREKERKNAIRNGFLADPDKPTSLANAITPVGTCQDMCPEFERVERIVQLMVDGSEKEATEADVKVPCEALMVKRFRRSAAGYDEQLPSDIRPPNVLKRALDYLINDVVGGSEPLSVVHKFVWDRTRGIRNDFSIQQVTKTGDLRLAIECFERIARFHILSLHQLSNGSLVDNEFDHHQEREQLNNTLLSLMYYYDDSRHKLVSPNEAEFRAYCIIFEIQDQRPDLEDRVQSWPKQILKHPRVQIALKLYAAAGNTTDEQGPLRPRTPFSIAQANAEGFWAGVKSSAISYLTACVAEIYFNLVRAAALETLWKAYKGKRGGSAKMEDWVLTDLTLALCFDNDDQTITFCEDHGLVIAENDKGNAFVDFGSVAAGQLSDSNPRRKQVFSKGMVESKRLGRTLPAIIDGITASQAQAQGLIEEYSDTDSDANSESLFLDGDSDVEGEQTQPKPKAPPADGVDQLLPAKLNATANPFKPSSVFGHPSGNPNPFASVGNQSFPSTSPLPFDGLGKPETAQTNLFPRNEASNQAPFQKPTLFSSDNSISKDNNLQTKAASSSNLFAPRPVTTDKNGAKELPTFNFLSPSSEEKSQLLPPSPAPQQASSVLTPPSTSTGIEKPLKNAPVDGPSTTLFSWGTPAANNPSPQQKPEQRGSSSNDKENESEPSPQSKPVLSFGTPPIFNSKIYPPEADLTTLENDTSLRASAVLRSQPALTSHVPNSPDINTPASDNKATSLPSPFSFPSTSNTHLTSQSTPSDANLASVNPPSQQPFSLTPAAADQKSKLSSEAFPKAQNFAQSSKTAAKTTSDSTLSFQASDTNTAQQPTKSDQLSSRAKALGSVATILMTEDRGLLQQFVEFSIAPILKTAVAKFEDDKSWARAREYRDYLLARKYCARWKLIAWNLGLKRRAKKRRGNLARSLREGSRDSPTSNSIESSPLARTLAEKSRMSAPSTNSAMGPPSASSSLMKRQSLPADLIMEGRSVLAAAGSKRKRPDPDPDTEMNTAPQKATLKSLHRRTKTYGGSVGLDISQRSPRTSLHSEIEAARRDDGSLLGDALDQQARRLAPGTRLDTTRTNYFKLKAMGINPNILLSSESKPNPGASPGNAKDARVKPVGIAHMSRSAPIPQKSTKPADDDEDLFASIRKVREALAETTTWFQSERQTIERSMTPQSAASPPRNESAAEKRLREIRERGTTPTRTELRQRAMADKSLLPNGLSDRNLKEKQKQEKETLMATPTRKPLGFAALAEQNSVHGLSNGTSRVGDRSNTPSTQQGLSIEDAIEL